MSFIKQKLKQIRWKKLAASCVWVGILLVFSFRYMAHDALAQTTTEKIGDIISALFGYVSAFCGWVVTLFIDILINVAQFNTFVDHPIVNTGWVVVRDLCNMFFILMLLVIAFSTILHISEYNYKRHLATLLIYAVLINFSKTIAGLFIDFAQVIMLTFVSAFAVTGRTNFAVTLGLGAITGIDPKLQAMAIQDGSVNYLLNLTLSGVFSALLAFIAMCVVGILLISLIWRIIMLWILLILSPIPYLLKVIPIGKGHAGRWWSEFGKTLAQGPVLAFFLWLALTVAGDPTMNNLVAEDAKKYAINFGIGEAGKGSNVFKYIVSVGLLLAGLKFSSEMGGVAGSLSSKVSGKVGAFAMGALTGGIAVAKWPVKKTWQGAKAVTKGVGLGLVSKVTGGEFWRGGFTKEGRGDLGGVFKGGALSAVGSVIGQIPWMPKDIGRGKFSLAVETRRARKQQRADTMVANYDKAGLLQTAGDRTRKFDTGKSPEEKFAMAKHAANQGDKDAMRMLKELQPMFNMDSSTSEGKRNRSRMFSTQNTILEKNKDLKGQEILSQDSAGNIELLTQDMKVKGLEKAVDSADRSELPLWVKSILGGLSLDSKTDEVKSPQMIHALVAFSKRQDDIAGMDAQNKKKFIEAVDKALTESKVGEKGFTQEMEDSLKEGRVAAHQFFKNGTRQFREGISESDKKTILDGPTTQDLEVIKSKAREGNIAARATDMRKGQYIQTDDDVGERKQIGKLSYVARHKVRDSAGESKQELLKAEQLIKDENFDGLKKSYQKIQGSAKTSNSLLNSEETRNELVKGVIGNDGKQKSGDQLFKASAIGKSVEDSLAKAQAAQGLIDEIEELKKNNDETFDASATGQTRNKEKDDLKKKIEAAQGKIDESGSAQEKGKNTDAKKKLEDEMDALTVKIDSEKRNFESPTVKIEKVKKKLKAINDSLVHDQTVVQKTIETASMTYLDRGFAKPEQRQVVHNRAKDDISTGISSLETLPVDLKKREKQKKQALNKIRSALKVVNPHGDDRAMENEIKEIFEIIKKKENVESAVLKDLIDRLNKINFR